jgi:hypothetical protein
MSLALNGLVSGASNISSNCSMSSMMRPTSIRLSIANQLCSPTSGAAVRTKIEEDCSSPSTQGDRILFKTTKNMKIEARVSNSGSSHSVEVATEWTPPFHRHSAQNGRTRLQHQWRRTAVCSIGDLLLQRFVSRSSKTHPQRAPSGCRSHRHVRPARRSRTGHQLSSKSGRRGISVGHRRVNSRNGQLSQKSRIQFGTAVRFDCWPNWWFGLIGSSECASLTRQL